MNPTYLSEEFSAVWSSFYRNVFKARGPHV